MTRYFITSNIDNINEIKAEGLNCSFANPKFLTKADMDYITKDTTLIIDETSKDNEIVKDYLAANKSTKIEDKSKKESKKGK